MEGGRAKETGKEMGLDAFVIFPINDEGTFSEPDDTQKPKEC